MSIMAGVPIASIQSSLKHEAIVRAIPNTPAQIGEGMTVWTATDAVTEPAREAVRSVLSVLGAEIYVADEKYVDMATAVSSGGPAYVFLVIEAMIDAAVHIGLRREMAVANGPADDPRLCATTPFRRASTRRSCGTRSLRREARPPRACSCLRKQGCAPHSSTRSRQHTRRRRRWEARHRSARPLHPDPCWHPVARDYDPRRPVLDRLQPRQPVPQRDPRDHRADPRSRSVRSCRASACSTFRRWSLCSCLR